MLEVEATIRKFLSTKIFDFSFHSFRKVLSGYVVKYTKTCAIFYVNKFFSL